MSSVNERIAKYRRLSNLTQTDMAEKLNIKCSTYSQMERKGIISAERLHQMAEIFGISPCYLFNGEEPCKKEVEESRNNFLQFEASAPTFMNQPEPPRFEREIFVITKKEENLIKLIRNLSKENYNKTIKFIEDIHKKEKR